jgi:hypothetical protein
MKKNALRVAFWTLLPRKQPKDGESGHISGYLRGGGGIVCSDVAMPMQTNTMRLTIPTTKLATKNDIKTNWIASLATQFQERRMSDMMTRSRGWQDRGSGAGCGVGSWVGSWGWAGRENRTLG